ncbi:MAG TPA: NAD-dependent epimerase/dehydratase family protein [Candidatus Obscuribacterales bacterium]
MLENVFITGGAGFVGSHFVDRLLSGDVKKVTVFDNFSSGKNWHLSHHTDSRLHIIAGEIGNLPALEEAMNGHETVIHLASNPDIARAATEPTIDFDQGTILTNNVVEAMRRTGAKRILYSSGSGVYGDTGELEVAEDYGPMVPISTYGASKLAGEALISAYCYMFDMSGVAFRFGNVVGPRQTHGVGYDFIRKLRETPAHLDILGDGKQSKSYVYITDIIDAVLLAHEKVTKPFEVFNVATGDYITVKEIAGIAIGLAIGPQATVHLRFSGGDRGWKGDVPVVRLNTEKIKALGWSRKHSSAEAIKKSIKDMLEQNQAAASGRRAD